MTDGTGPQAVARGGPGRPGRLWPRLDRVPTALDGRLATLRARGRARSLDLLVTSGVSLLLRLVLLTPALLTQAALLLEASTAEPAAARAAALQLVSRPGFWLLWVGTTVVVATAWHGWHGWRSGATPAKRRLGVRVVDAGTLGPLGPGQALLRALVRALVPLTLGLALVPALLDDHQRALHDRVARTVVVRAGQGADAG